MQCILTLEYSNTTVSSSWYIIYDLYFKFLHLILLLYMLPKFSLSSYILIRIFENV